MKNDICYKIDIFERMTKYGRDILCSGHNSNINPYIKHGVHKHDTVWQQMSVEYFFNLLNTNTLYFKAINKYNERDERKLGFYSNHYFKDIENKELRKTAYKIITNFQENIYLSCWYQDEHLTDIIFKEYTKGNIGVAISTSVEKLINVINNNSIHNDEDCEIFYGRTAYIEDNRKENLFSLSDVILPIFLKSRNHNEDKELRLCYVKNNSRKDGENEKTEDIYYQIEDAFELINKIAVRKGEEHIYKLIIFILEKLKFDKLDKSGCEDINILTDDDKIIFKYKENSREKQEVFIIKRNQIDGFIVIYLNGDEINE